jgi:hypothetical protein
VYGQSALNNTAVLYDKNSESEYLFFLHPNQNIFFSNIGNQNMFLEKNHNPPLQVKWSFPKAGFIEVTVRSQGSEQSCMCVLRGIDAASFYDFSSGFWNFANRVVL